MIANDGSFYMVLKGEKYPMAGFPRGSLIVNSPNEPFSKFSILKHKIKNEIFNESWKMMEDKIPNEKIIERFKKDAFQMIRKQIEDNEFEMLPVKRLAPAVKEIYKAFTAIAERLTGDKRKKVENIRDIITYILQEDDGYRFRVQWLAQFMPRYFRKTFYKCFFKGLDLMRYAEVSVDMKERITLLSTILKIFLEDNFIRLLFEKFCEEVDWKKVKLTKADKYYFRAKYFKVDYPEYEY